MNVKERMKKIILHLCADIGSDTLPYKQAGYDVRLITKKTGIENFHPPENVYGIIANPPCAMFSIARTTTKPPRDLQEGMRLVKECLRIIWEYQFEINPSAHKTSLTFWALENPATGMLKYFLGKPVFEYQPYEYGANFTKKTALWGYFNLPIRPILYNPIKSGRSLVKNLTSGGSKKRSECFYPFAQAFFEANQ